MHLAVIVYIDVLRILLLEQLERYFHKVFCFWLIDFCDIQLFYYTSLLNATNRTRYDRMENGVHLF